MENTKTKLDTKQLEKVFTEFRGSLLTDKTSELKIFPSLKEIPSSNEDKSKRILGRAFKVTGQAEYDKDMAYTQTKRLETMIKMLKNSEDVSSLSEFSERLKDSRDKVKEVFDTNFKNIFQKQRKLEKTYHEINSFFYEAQVNPGEKLNFIHFINASPNEHYTELKEALPKILPSKENFDMSGLVGLMVMPEWPKSQSMLKDYGEIAESTSSHLFTGFVEDMDLEEVHEEFRDGDFQDLKSTERYKQYISVVANPLRIRRSNEYEQEDLYINPAPVLVGKIYKGDVKEGIHVAQANVTHKVTLPTPDDLTSGSALKLKWDIKGANEMKFNKAVIPLAHNQGIVFWGVDTLFKAGDTQKEMDQYTVKRSDEYIAKVLLHFLNGETFTINDQRNRDRIRESLSKFLMQNTGTTKMLASAKVSGVNPGKNEDGTENNQALDIDIEVKYKNAVRHLDLHLVSEADNQWKEG